MKAKIKGVTRILFAERTDLYSRIYYITLVYKHRSESTGVIVVSRTVYKNSSGL